MTHRSIGRVTLLLLCLISTSFAQANAPIFARVDPGFFQVKVEPGQDGRLWKFENSQGQRLMATVPPYFARSADELLLPREVVERDAE